VPLADASHPFMDGNGRVGRLFLSILIEEWCNLSGQWLDMSAYFDANKERYMDLRFRVEQRRCLGGMDRVLSCGC
jgi:Fic family protein